jgi:hypothetical protein
MYTITVDNGQLIQDAINSIPDEGHIVPWTIKVHPGIYYEDVIINRMVVIVGEGYNTYIKSITIDTDYSEVNNVTIINNNNLLLLEDGNHTVLNRVWFVSNVIDPKSSVIKIGEQSSIQFNNCSFTITSKGLDDNTIFDIGYNCNVQFNSCGLDIDMGNSNQTKIINTTIGSVNLGIFNSYFKLLSGNDPIMFNLQSTLMLMVNTIIDYGINVKFVESVIHSLESVLYILSSSILYNSKYYIDKLLRDDITGVEEPTWLYILNSVVNGAYKMVVRYNDIDGNEEEVDISEDPYIFSNSIFDGQMLTNSILNLGPVRTNIKVIREGDVYDTTDYDHTLLVSNPNMTIKLSIGSYGQELIIKNISTGDIYVEGDIYGLSLPLTLPTTRVLRLQYDGYNWYKL